VRGWKPPAIFGCCCLGLLLGAAAAPPGDCFGATDGGQTLPAPLDLAGQPNTAAGLTGQMFARLPGVESGNGCRGALPSSAESTTLRSESGDILHGLPSPDVLRRMDEPKRAPQFQ
jgi:hypothetical protein